MVYVLAMLRNICGLFSVFKVPGERVEPADERLHDVEYAAMFKKSFKNDVDNHAIDQKVVTDNSIRSQESKNSNRS